MVSNEFKRKKIDSLTLGERMKRIRSERRLSFNEISKNTRIQIKYLEYLENGEYEKLPADVYVKGFLKSYAEYVGANERSLIKIYEREKGIQKNIKGIEIKEKIIEPVHLSRWVVTPKIIVASVVTLFVFLGFFYLYKEVDTFIANPRLVIVSPEDGAVIDGRTVTVSGITEKDSEAVINDQPVMVNDAGEFSEEVGLQEGLNVITVKSKNKFDKEAIKSVSISANYQDSIPDNPSPEIINDNAENKKIDMEVSVRPSPTWISVEADGNIVFSGTLLPDAVQTFSAREKISVTSGKGSGTYIKVNGKDLGALSKDQGIVRDVVFDTNTKY
jgi:cytoskeleton protein RodZ